MTNISTLVLLVVLSACSTPTEPPPKPACAGFAQDSTNVKFIALVECKSHVDTLTIP